MGMPDIKETIQGLYALKTYLASKAIEEHGSARESLIGMQKVVGSAINLLKEQEPKKVEWRIGRAHCPSCGELFPRKKETQHIRFCNFCGQEVEWDEKL